MTETEITHPDEDKCEACGGYSWEFVGYCEKLCRGCGNIRFTDE